MKLQRFKRVCYVTSLLLNGLAFLMTALLVIGLFLSLFSESGTFIYAPQGMILIHLQNRSIDALVFETAGSIVAPFHHLMFIYIFWQGGKLFARLYEGDRPFSDWFTRPLKQISYLLIFSTIILPIFYSIAVSVIQVNGYFFTMYFNSELIIGLVLYAVSEVFHYGIELQRLSDETV